MKKALFFLATAALALAACNKVETLEENRGSALNFRTFASPLTRASSTVDVTTANIAKFKVTAFNVGQTTNPYINDVTYSKDGSGVFWVAPSDATHGSEYYWPANNLDFYAYSWYDGSDYFSGSQVAKTAYNTFTYTPSKTADAAYADLVVATIQNIGKDDTYSSGTYGSLGIPLNFRHAASKIAVKVKNTSATLNFDIDSWKVGYLDDAGTFILSETSTVNHHTNAEGVYTNLLAFSDWTNNATAAVANEYVSTFASVNIAANATETALGGEMILVPQALVAATAHANSGTAAVGDDLNGTFLAVKLIIRNSDANSTIIYGTPASGGNSASTLWAIWPIGGTSETPFNWEPGKKYTYTIDLAGGGYYEKNHDTDADLDPILENTLIRFVDVKVDDWQDYDYDGTTDGVQPIPVAM